MRLRQATHEMMAIACAGALTLYGCGSLLDIEERERAPYGRCDGTLQLRILGDDSSSMKDGAMPAMAAIIDYVNWINENGGVRGCNVSYQYVNGRSEASIATSTYSSWKSSGDWGQISSIFAFGSNALQAIGSPASTDQQVVVGIGFDGVLAATQEVARSVNVPAVNNEFGESLVLDTMRSSGYPYVFFQGTDNSTSARLAMMFIAQQGGKRVGFFACNDSGFCTAPVAAAKTYLVSEEMVASGVAVGRTLTLPIAGTQAEYDAAILAYLEAEVAQKLADPNYQMVDWLWFGNPRKSAVQAASSIASAVATIRAANPELDFNVKVMANNWAFDEVFMNDAYAYLEGRWWGVQPFVYYNDTSAEGTAPMRQVHWTYRTLSGFPAGSIVMYEVIEYVYGYAAMLAWKTAAEKLIDAHGVVTAEEVRGTALKDAFESFDGIYLDGLSTARIRYTSSDHRPQDSVAIYRTEGGRPVFEKVLQVSLQEGWLGW